MRFLRRLGSWTGGLFGALVLLGQVIRLGDLGTYLPMWKPFFQWVSFLMGTLNDSLLVFIGLALILVSEPGMWTLRRLGLLSSVYYEVVEQLEGLLFRVNWPRRGSLWVERDPYCRKCRCRMITRQPRQRYGEFELFCPNVSKCGTRATATESDLTTLADLAKSRREARGRW